MIPRILDSPNLCSPLLQSAGQLKFLEVSAGLTEVLGENVRGQTILAKKVVHLKKKEGLLKKVVGWWI